MNRTSRQKINKKIEDLNTTIAQMDLTDIYITFHPQKENIHSFQVYAEQFPGYITC